MVSAVLLIVLWSAVPVRAQLPAAGSQDPGISPERIPQADTPQPEPESDEPSAVQPDLPPGAEEVRFFLADILVEGSTVYEDSDLRPLFAEFVNSEISLANLYGIASAIESRYREEGYVLSRAIVPAQSVSDGVYRIQVIEGYVTGIVLEGDVGPSRALVERYLNRIPERRPVNIADIERYLLLMNDLPGISGTGVLRPSGSDVGAAELVVTAQRKAWDGFALTDNRGSEFTGELGASVGVAGNSFTPYGDRTQGVLFAALDDREQIVGQITYDQKVGSDGAGIGVLASYGESEPGGLLDPLDIEQETLFLRFIGDYPYKRSRRLNFSAEAGFDWVDQKTDVLGGATNLSDDNLRVLFANAVFDNRDSWNGANTGRIGIRQGLDIFGASEEGDDNLSRIEGDPQFTSLRGEIARLQRIAGNFNFFGRLGGQYSNDKLLSTEEFKLGGLTFGRGYDPSELTGDSGLGTNLELQYNQALGLQYFQSFQLYGYYDFGVVWNNDSNTSSRESLASAGIGVRTNLTAWLSADFEVAKPLTRERAGVADNGDSERYFFRFTGQF